jgi:3-hydroxybutyryl-CoA dehydrogenase
MSDCKQKQQLPSFAADRPVAIIGTGVMGTLVAWACVNSGLETRLYDVSAEQCALACRQVEHWMGAPSSLLVPVDSIADAVAGAQLAFENVPEKLDLKAQVLAEIDRCSAYETFVGSNTSSLQCAPLAAVSGRADRFFNMNFCNPRTSRLVEVMGCAETLAETLDFAKAWASHLGLVAIHVRKDQMGYSHNRLWRAIKKEALRQIDQGIATPEDIDRGWMLAFGVDIGPCGIMDAVGLATILSVEESYYRELGDETDRPPEVLKQLVKEGKLGVQAGVGFYRYPDPAFRHASFLDPPT